MTRFDSTPDDHDEIRQRLPFETVPATLLRTPKPYALPTYPSTYSCEGPDLTRIVGRESFLRNSQIETHQPPSTLCGEETIHSQQSPTSPPTDPPQPPDPPRRAFRDEDS